MKKPKLMTEAEIKAVAETLREALMDCTTIEGRLALLDAFFRTIYTASIESENYGPAYFLALGSIGACRTAMEPSRQDFDGLVRGLSDYMRIESLKITDEPKKKTDVDPTESGRPMAN